MRKRGLVILPNVVKLVATIENNKIHQVEAEEISLKNNYIMQFVQDVDAKPRFLSSQQEKNQYIAGNVLAKEKDIKQWNNSLI
jgi:hypothetical protein